MILLLIVVTFWIVVTTSNRSKLKLSANVQSANLLKDELMDEIERVQKHCKLYKTSYYILSFISVIGSVAVSLSFFQGVFFKSISAIGFFILLATLLSLFFRPLDRYYRAKVNIAYLKKTEREFNDKLTTDIKIANSYLRSRLNQYERNQYENMMF